MALVGDAHTTSTRTVCRRVAFTRRVRTAHQKQIRDMRLRGRSDNRTGNAADTVPHLDDCITAQLNGVQAEPRLTKALPKTNFLRIAISLAKPPKFP